VTEGVATRTSDGVTQLEAAGSWIKSLSASRRRRFFISGGGGTSFDGDPLPTEQFALGGPLRLSAFDSGEARGDHFLLATAGYLHQVFRLPDFLGGPVFLGGWTDLGSAFNSPDEAELETHFSAVVIGETLIGPIFAGTSISADGDNRFYIGIGKLFR
jgi:NTE family protein